MGGLQQSAYHPKRHWLLHAADPFWCGGLTLYDVSSSAWGEATRRREFVILLVARQLRGRFPACAAERTGAAHRHASGRTQSFEPN
jgi:hypothetical protein